MTSQPIQQEPPFKDYCLALQVHPEADAGMIEAAYWHLAKRYNEQSDTDPLAAAKLDELNEAYSVLGSPERREQYFQVRNAILGIGALPKPPVEAPETPPLAVLSRQKPRERSPERAPKRLFDLRIGRFLQPSWQNTLLVLVFLTLATATLAASLSLAVVLALLALSMTVSAIPLVVKAMNSSAADAFLHEPGPSSSPDS